MDTRELEGMLPQKDNIESNTIPMQSIEVDTYTPPVAEILEEPKDWNRQDIFNLYNSYFGVSYNTGLNEADTYTQTWEPGNSTWVSNLSLDDKLAVSKANSEEYAKQIMDRRVEYKESQARVMADEGWAPTIAGFGASMIDPTIIAPIGVTAAATKSAYTLGAKATRLAALSAESAVVSMASTSLSIAAEQGQGYGQADYGTANLYAGLIGGGLPIIGNMLGGGYATASVAAGLTSDPKNFALLTGELTAEKFGGTQLRTMYTKLMPDFLQSDVTFTASSDNKYITLISNRIDSPPMAVVDRNTGKVVPIPTTGQDYKSKFNGRKRMTISDIEGLYTESSYTNLEQFRTEVGKVVRARATTQENAVYQELHDHTAFTKNEIELNSKEERDLYVNENLAYYKNAEGKDSILTPDELAVVEKDRAALDVYKQEQADYNAQQDALANEELDYINNMLAQYKAEGKSPKELKVIKKDLIDTIKEANKDILPLEPIMPTPEFKYEVKVKKRTNEDIKKYDEDLKVRSDEAISKSIDEKRIELYNTHQIEFSHHDPKVIEAAQRTEKYYADVLEEGHKLKIAEMQQIAPNRHYMTRIFDFQKIREIEMPMLISKLSKAIEGHASAKSATAEEILKAAKEIATQLKQLDYTRDWADYSFMVPKELGSTSFLNQRQYKLNDSFIDDLLVTDIDDVLGQYSYAQAGHYAANHAFPELQGVPRAEQIDVFRDKFVDPLVETGAKAKEVKALQNMFEDMLGTFRMAKDSNSAVWKGTRIANSINSLTYGGSFALNTAAELGGLLLGGHVSNVMKTRLGSLKEIGTMFSGKTIEDPLVRDFVLMGQMENLFETNSMMKMSDTDTVFNVGKVEDNLNKANSVFFKYNGLRGATVALEAMAGPKIIHDLLDFGKKITLSDAQEKYLARIGLTHSDAIKINKHLVKVGKFTKSGKIYDLNLDQWSDELLDKITTGVGRGIRHTVIKGDSTYLPSWMIKPNAFNRLAFQFLRYPMAATETLMARGMNESMAQWMAATGTSTFMMAMVMYGREQAAIAIGAMDEREAKFHNFWEDDEAAIALFTAALGKAGTLGGSSIFVDKLSALGGVPTPGSEYAASDPMAVLLGPTFSRIPQIANILGPLLTEGELNNKAQWNGMRGLTPGATAPIVSEWLATQIKENTY